MSHPRLAALATVFHPGSHADVILSRWMKPRTGDGEWGRPQPKSEISSLWMDQIPENDLGRNFCQEYNIPLCASIEEALTLGTGSLAVDGVLIIAEHGHYPRNHRGQTLYPRKEFFDEVVKVFIRDRKSVPIFCDKHLSWSPSAANEMVATARRLNFPLFAGSTVPYCDLFPGPIIAAGEPVEEALGVFFDSVEHYGFHSLEFIQSITEHRPGGEAGIRSVVAYEGSEVGLRLTGALRQLLERALTLEKNSSLPQIEKDIRAGKYKQILFSLEHRDGFKSHHLMLDDHVTGFIAALQMKDGELRSARAKMGDATDFYGHFARLDALMEEMFLNQTPPVPINRTLLTTHAIAACMEALQSPGKSVSLTLRPEADMLIPAS